VDDLRAVDREREERIDKVTLRKNLGDRLVGHRLLYFLSLPSTNRHVRELAEDGWPEGTMVMAEEQTAGRGRLERTWHSPPGVGLHFSFLLRPNLPADKVPLLTLMASVGVARGLRDHGHQAEIKWPNDLLLAGRKIAGILAERRDRPSVPPEVMLGIGLNVNHTEEHFPADLLPKAGSIRIVTGCAVDRTEILTSVLIRIDETYERFKSAGELSMLETYQGLCPMARGASVTVTQDSESFTGETAGIASTGALRLSTPSGMREVHAGDVTLAEAPDAPGR
jgi:BirA family biotin operon repressor/biotin-[acetyl-CoA-carboxylase] ligase